MYPATNLANFVDPVQDPTVEVERILVQRLNRVFVPSLGGHSSDGLLNTIVEVKNKRYFDGHYLWYIAASGEYVQGAPVNPPIATGNTVVGVISDDVFVVGVLAERPFGNATPFVRINNVMRSDRQTLGGQEFSTRSCHVSQYVKAAPWAERLLPTVSDGVGSASAKLALAAQFYQKRRAQAEIISQMTVRDLEEDLVELTENYSLPTPTFGALVTASAFIPSMGSLDSQGLEGVRAVMDRAGDAALVNTTAYARITLSFMYPGDAGNSSDVRAFNVNSLSQHANRVLKAQGLSISDPTLTPAMRGLSF
jgi:hypothetical protein